MILLANWVRVRVRVGVMDTQKFRGWTVKMFKSLPINIYLLLFANGWFINTVYIDYLFK